jgi:hypothetical protein
MTLAKSKLGGFPGMGATLLEGVHTLTLCSARRACTAAGHGRNAAATVRAMARMALGEE